MTDSMSGGQTIKPLNHPDFPISNAKHLILILIKLINFVLQNTC